VKLSPIRPHVKEVCELGMEHALRYAVGLAHAQVYNNDGDLIILGFNQSIRFDSEPPKRPRTHELTKQPWCLHIKQLV
jgi:hypothetical protein